MQTPSSCILGIETSCDETSAALVRDGRAVLSCIISSSRKDFERTGGVIPEQAAREQLRCILPVIEACMREAQISLDDIDAIAVTAYPGLLGSLLVGTATARVLAHVWRKPLIAVHHTLGHLASVWLYPHNDTAPPAPEFPALALSVSGGHSDIWLRHSHTSQTLLGSTLDDAAGEAFDKGATQLGLPYPGGPALEALARDGRDDAYEFPRPLLQTHHCDFSFSGMKTALKYALQERGGIHALQKNEQADMAASYQAAIVRHIIDRLDRAIAEHTVRELHIVGGVSANGALRTAAMTLCTEKHLRLRTPSTLRYCTDNAAMIASAGAFLWHEDPERACVPFITQASVPLQ